MKQRTVANEVINLTLAHIQNKNERKSILENCNIKNHELSGRHTRISAPRHYRFIEEALKAKSFFTVLDQEYAKTFFDLFFQHFNDIALLCLNARSPLDAIENLIQFRPLMGTCDELIQYKNKDLVFFEYINLGPASVGSSQAIRHFYLIKTIIDCYVQVPCQDISISDNPQIDMKLSSDFFNVAILSNQQRNIMSYKIEDLAQAFDMYNPKLYSLQKNKLLKNMQALVQDNSYSSTIRLIIADSFKQADLSEANLLDYLCETLKTSRWTINRRLNEEGTSFSNILKTVRLDEGCRLLKETDQAIQEISDSLGFSSPAVFTRFFKTVNHITPMDYRLQQV